MTKLFKLNYLSHCRLCCEDSIGLYVSPELSHSFILQESVDLY